MIPGLLATYDARRKKGALKPDPDQRRVAGRLDRLCRALAAPPRRPRRRLLARLGLRRAAAVADEGPRGLYIHGPPGRGKSMLMDLFFDAAPLAAKRRVHVHAFMQEVHERLHLWLTKNGGRQVEDPLRELGRSFAETTRLLCFDEFQVEAVADAMIVQRLFESLLDAGVVVVATSNTPPDRLYHDGLQRERFLPFVAILKQRLDVVAMGGATDYRRDRLKAAGVYHAPLGPAAAAALDDIFRGLTDGATGRAETLAVHGRKLVVPRQAQGVARFAFAELCERPLGPADYLRIACRYQTVILAGIPRLGPAQRNAAKRFAVLVESLYEQRVKLVCSAAVAPDRIYTEGDGADVFRRVASRLEEMQSETYLAEPHRPASARAAA